MAPGSTHALITLVGLDLSAVLRAAIFISNLLICLNLTCQSRFFVRFHFNYLFHMTGLAALAIMMTKLATDHCQLTTVYYCMGLTLSTLPVFFFFCKVTVSPPIFSNDLLVVCQLTIFHDIPVLINSSVKTVSGTLKETL